MRSSQAAVDMIVGFEVTSQATYTAKYRPPTWPGGESGVTIGIGYDCGYSTPSQIRSDWSDQLPAGMVDALAGAAGLKGLAAQRATQSLRGAVSVPWAAAMAVFMNRDMPKWEGILSTTLPNTDLLPPDCFGALVSLIYNRGASFTAQGDRYLEMRQIHANMGAKNFDAIPDNIDAMCRLWPNVVGLRDRRKQEAALFKRGLAGGVVPAPVSHPAPPVLHDVRWLQASLNSLGEQPPLIVDGSYGANTYLAVKKFQIAHKMKPDGVAGVQTIGKISELLGT